MAEEILKKSSVEAVLNAANSAIEQLQTNDNQVQSSISQALSETDIQVWSYDIGVLPALTGDDGAIGAYFKSNFILQKLEEVGGEWVDLGAPIITSPLFQDFTKIRNEDVQKVFSLIQTEGLRIAVMGDSTEAGSGGNGNVYAETNGMIGFTHPTLLAYALMNADPNFIAPDERVYTLTDATTGTALGRPLYDYYELIYSNNPTLSFKVRTIGKSQSVFTVYYIQRTSDAAPTFDVTLNELNGTQIESEIIDTYVAPIDFGSVTTEDVDGRLVAATIATSDHRDFEVVIDNLTLVDRGSGVAGDGTVAILGFALGNGVDLRNFAVSSTTLKDDSTANSDRGVTTSGQLQKAFDFGANMFLIGWGTNDSKTGVSDIDTFKAEYAVLISDILAENPQSIIILMNDPTGESGSIYENNPAYNQAVRDIALSNNKSLFDVESILNALPSTSLSDEVHPSNEGYQALGAALCRAFGISQYGIKTVKLVIDESTFSGQAYWYKAIDESSNSDFTGTFVEVESLVFNKDPNDKNLVFGAKINVARSGDDLEECAFQIKIIGYTGEDEAGSASSEVLIDESIVSIPQVNGLAIGQVILNAPYTFTSDRKSVKVILYGKNYQIRSTAASSLLYTEKVTGYISQSN